MKSTTIFSLLLHKLCSQRSISGNTILKERKINWSILVFMVSMLFASMQVNADTYFNPNDLDHFRVECESGAMGFSRAKIRAFTLETSGINDGMRSIEIFYVLNGVETKICDFGTDDGGKVCSKFNSQNTLAAGYMHDQTTEGDRYTNVWWIYPQILAGKTVQIRYKWHWDININGVDRTGTNDFYITLPSIPASTIVNPLLKIINVDSNGNLFNFSWTSFYNSLNNSYVMNGLTFTSFTKLMLYSNIERTKLIGTSSNTDGNSGNLNMYIPLSTYSKVNTIYPKLEYTINSQYDIKKQYYDLPAVSSKDLISPSSIQEPTFDKCGKNVILNWIIYDNNKTASTDGKWIVERRLSTESTYTELDCTLPASTTSYTDNSILYDKIYNYRVRFLPTGFTKTNILSELTITTVNKDTKRTVLNTMSFSPSPKNVAENPKIKITWNPNWCFNSSIVLQRKNTVTGVVTDKTITSSDNNNTNNHTDENLTENLIYEYRFKINTEGLEQYTTWQPVEIKDQVKYKSVTSSKGTLADRIQLKWNIEREDLSNSFFIKREIYEEGRKNPSVNIVNVATANNTYFSYEDKEIAPGILYKYTLGSQFKLQSGKIDTVYYISDIIGYAQASGTVSGRVTFGSGTAVDSVSVFASNANESESLYRAIKFEGTSGGIGKVALTPEKHGCVKDGFSWQAWLKPQSETKSMGIYECLKEYSIWYEYGKLEIYLDQINNVTSLISYDMRSYSKDKYFHTSVTFDGNDKLLLYINGKEVASKTLAANQKLLVDKCENLKLRGDTTIAYIGDGFYAKGAYNGYIDDLRLWSYPLTASEISNSYNRYINGNESGLIGYWQFDEGLNGYAFDKSNYKKIYNEHHIRFTTATSSTTVPSLEQLSIKGITDKNGNYLISGVPFTGDGSTYSFTASKQSHEFDPSQLSRHLTFQSSVHNAVDFKDISSFKVSIKAFYDNTSFPVDSVDVLVDGSFQFKDQKMLSTDINGECIIDVPIGIHTITVSRRGHTFVDGTKLSTSVKMNFTQPILGNPIIFYDQTKVILAGRLVGGVAQAEKSLGFGLSKANIGEANITLEAQGGDYQLNLSNNTMNLTGAITDTINSTATVLKGSKLINITTDAKTGEFRVMVPPLKYKVTDVTTRGGLNKMNFTLSEFQPDPNKQLNDTATINKKLKKFNYHQRLDFTYRVDKISIDVFDPMMPTGVYGDSIFNYTNLTNKSNVKVPLYNRLNNNAKTPAYDANGKPVYKYGYPIYETTKIYKLRIKAYEQYTHPDNLPEMVGFCKVPASNAIISIQNEMGRYELPLGSTGNPAGGDEMQAKTNEYQFNQEGVFDYRFKAGFPNLVAPYTLGLKIEVDYKDKKSAWDGNTSFKAIVLGDILTGTDFITSGPDLISFVLRDPPGSNSYSYMEKGTTVSNSYSFSKSYVGSENVLGSLNYGQSVKVAVGFGVAKIEEMIVENKTGAGVEISQSAGSGSEINFSTTTTERIETSSSTDYVGRRGDVYVGTSTNMFFGTSKRLAPTLVGANYELNVKDEKVGDLSAKTNFKYTYAHIVETLIPSITKLRNDLIDSVGNINSATPYVDKVRYVTTLSKSDPKFGEEGTYSFIAPSNKVLKQYDNEVKNYNSSIAGWIKELAKEEDAKIKANDSKEGEIYNKTNESADAGVTSEKSITICGSSNKTDISSFNRQGVFKTENGFSYNSLGFQIEIETKHGAESETVTGEGEEYCTTYGYVISDENAGDYHSIDVYSPISKDYTYSTGHGSTDNIKKQFDSYSGAPLFIIRGGRTSCPYEAQEVVQFSTANKGKALGVATLQIEKPGLKVANPFATAIPSGKEATYKITLSNLSESNTAGWYMLSVDEKTNTKGAIITVDGQTLGNGKLYYVVPEEPMEKVLKIKQSSLDELDYKDITLLLSSTCQSDINSSIVLSAQFVPSCSDITLEIANKIVNATTSDVLPIKLTNYNRDYKNFGGIVLKYKTINQDETQWTTIRKFINNPSILASDQISQNITSATINYDYSMKNNTDQTYQFKAFTVCAFGTGTVQNESEVITVIKDMVTPTSLGVPSPSNGVLTPESEVSITFNEEIQNNLLNSTNMKVEGVLNGNALKNNVGLEFTGTTEAYTEQQFNLQAVPVSIEAWIKTNQVNTNGTLFAIGEGENQLKLQLTGNTLKAIAGNEVFTGNINADANWQYMSISYNPTSKNISVNVTGQMNNNVKVIDQTIVGSIEPSGRLYIGNGYIGNMTQLSVWMKDRDLSTMAEDRNISKSGRESGLMGYWPLNEGFGNLAADKVKSRSLTLKTDWFIDPKGKAIQVNGINQNVIISTTNMPITSQQDFSLEFWFKTNNLPNVVQKNTTLFSCGKGVNDLDSINNLSVGFDAAGKLSVFAKGNTHIITTQSIQDNQWHHFAMSVMRRGNTNVLVDGIAKYQVISTKFGGLEASKMSLGARYYKTDKVTFNYTPDQYFNGMLDELRIWKGALTAENIRLDKNNKLIGSEAGLAAYYPFEEYTVNGANQTVIASSLKDAIIPENGAVSGGIAQGSVTAIDVTPAIKEARVKENVYFNWTSTNNKIVFNILESLSKIENCVLEFTVDRALDLNGNRMSEPIKWTVFVDNNRLKWESDGQSLKKEILAPLTFKTNIVNNSGKYENFVVDGMPTWLSVNKSSGTLNPLEKAELTFTVDNSVNVGSYESRVMLTGNNSIQEMFPVSLKVTGPRPDWTVNPNDFESSMNITGQVKIDNVYQEDTEDILAAFIGTKCVGIVNPQFSKTLNSYVLYMDVYGNTEDAAKALTFSLWDAGTGRIYPGVDVVGGALTFSSGSIIGSVAAPKVFNAIDKVEQQLNIKKGWNWISTNVVNSAPSLFDQVKLGLETDGITLKSKTAFSNYSVAGLSWSGSLTSLNQRSMYLLRSGQPKTVKVIGSTAKSVDYPISIGAGWNWIAYVPQFVAPIQEALSSLNAVDGDQIKGQVGFATYSGGNWNGSLQYLVPGQGYMFNSNVVTTRTLTYPSQYISRSNVKRKTRNDQVMHWTYNENAYPQNMLVTAIVKIDDVESVNENLQVAAFIDNTCRGTINLIFDPSTNRYYAYMTVQGDGVTDVNKKITFKCFNPANNKELEAADKSIGYISDTSIGAAESPYVMAFSSVTTDQSDLMNGNRVIYPNPVINTLNFGYNPKDINRLEVVDCTGRTMVISTTVTSNSIDVSDLMPGIYTLRVNYKGAINSHRFIKK